MRFLFPCLLILAHASQSLRAAEQDSEAQPEFDAAAIEFFEREVRPLLVKRCYECHSADADEPSGGLRLDSRPAVIEGGDTGAAIVPNQPDASLLIDAVNYGELYAMPPKSKLPASEIAVLTKWVSMGAPWPDEQVIAAAQPEAFDLEARRSAHWCWHPIRDPTAPTVRDRAWAKRPLDDFVLARLEAAGLTPAAPADKRTLIRRASFDLIGLPPTTAELDTFLLDQSPQAFERVVDHLLDSPHFGERWARHWMDLVRYAETYGHEFDYAIPHAYKYRDYLIRAFNADIPYDQFVLEHIAGDLLQTPRLHPSEGYNESVIGTGFWWLGEATHAPVDVLGDEAGRIDNQIDVLSKTFLGLTVACARCHDHKFDAISTKDYYALAGFLQSSRRDEVLLDRRREMAAAMEQLWSLKRRGDDLVQQLYEGEQASGDRFARYLLAARSVMSAEPTDRLSIDEAAETRRVDAGRLSRWIDALSVDDVPPRSHPLYAWHRLAASMSDRELADTLAAIRDDVESDQDLDQRYPLFSSFDDFSSWFVTGHAFGSEPTSGCEWDTRQGDATRLRGAVANSGRVDNRLPGVLRSPTFTLEHPNLYYRVKGKGVKIRLVLDGYFMDTNSALLFKGFAFDVDSPDEFRWHRQSEDVGRYLGHRAYIEILDYGDGAVEIDEIRFSHEDSPPDRFSAIAARVVRADPASLEAVAEMYGSVWEAARSARTSAGGDQATAGEDQAALWNWVGRYDLLPSNMSVAEQLADLHREMQRVALPSTDRTLGLADGTSENQRIYVRGNHRTPGKEAPRQLLAALVREPCTIEHGSGRLQLAKQIASPENPLTARVMVNRIWHQLTGRGIVPSTDNFGVLGQPPTHPELLDHLATEFVREGWSIKRLLKQIMLSSTYQMASTPDKLNETRDPQNRLLHRARIRRLQGEAIRDSILAISGRLDRTAFGPSVPVHITPFMEGRGRPKSSGPLDGQGRRSVYLEVRRNFLSPMMLAFDTPIPFSSVGRRNTSNVPAQALIMMNDPFVVEQAALWARSVLEEQPNQQDRISAMYVAAFARPPSENEIADAIDFLRQQAESLGLTPQQAANDERIWADLCHVLMNVKEFVFLN